MHNYLYGFSLVMILIMVREVVFESFPSPESRKMEVVEIKGLGHPDTISDLVGAKLSVEYSLWCVNNLGDGTINSLNLIPHYNVDKLLLAGGESEKKWGGGRIIKPVIFNISGNVTEKIGGVVIPFRELAEKSVRSVVKKVIGDNFVYIVNTDNVSKGSDALITNYSNSGLLANDTSYGTGHAPLTKLENVVKRIHDKIYELRRSHSFIGSDIKVMGCRVNDDIFITLAVAVIDKHVSDAEDYINKIAFLQDDVFNSFAVSDVKINLADKPNKGGSEENYYLTVTGSSAEHADPGQIGRGNRASGFISARRSQTLEAVAGKNLTKHVGGFYNIWAQLISERVWNELSIPCEVLLLSRIGKPISDCWVGVTFFNKTSKTDELRVNEIVREVIGSHQENVWNTLQGKNKYYPFKYL